MIYLFHGEEEYLRSEELQKVRAAIEPADMVSLNTTRLDGSKTSFAELRHACDTVPFLSSRRLVVVDSLITYLTKPPKKPKKDTEESGNESGQPEGVESVGGEEQRELSATKKKYLQALADYLPQVPASTDLVLLEPKVVMARRKLMKVVNQLSTQNRARVVRCDTKKMRWGERKTWMRQRIMDVASAKGSRIASDALDELLRLVGDDLRLLDQEIEKLATYCLNRRIGIRDVRLLATRAQGPSIWRLVDNLGLKKPALAMAELHRLLQEPDEALAVLGMISRQYRLLLQTKDLMARGTRSGDMAKELGAADWQVRKLQEQARHYTIQRLEKIYTKLLDTDLSIKTGRAKPNMALVLLVAELAG